MATSNGTIDDASTDLDGDGQPDDRCDHVLRRRGRRHLSRPGPDERGQPARAGRGQERRALGGCRRSPPPSNLTIPSPIKVDFQILDDATGLPIPGRLLVDRRSPGVSRSARCSRSTTAPSGIVTQQHCDPRHHAPTSAMAPTRRSYLPGRRHVSRSTRRAAPSGRSQSKPVTASRHATRSSSSTSIPTPGYYATDWHVHQIGSPDSPVPSDERVRSAVSAGVEMFAVTDHDYVSDLQPLVESLAPRAPAARGPRHRGRRRSRTVTTTRGRSSPDTTSREPRRDRLGTRRGARQSR